MADAIKDQPLESSAATIKAALNGISGFTGDITFTNVASTASDINDVADLTEGDLTGTHKSHR